MKGALRLPQISARGSFKAADQGGEPRAQQFPQVRRQRMKVKEAEASEIYKAEYGGERLEWEEKEREGKLVSTEGLP